MFESLSKLWNVEDGAEKKAKLIQAIGEIEAYDSADLEPVDPSSGLILSQGHYILHLVFFIVMSTLVQGID